MRKFATRAIALLVSGRADGSLSGGGDPSGPGQPVGDRMTGWSHGMCQVLHVVPRLIDSYASGDDETREHAAKALAVLADQSPRANEQVTTAITIGSLAVEDFPGIAPDDGGMEMAPV